MGDLKEHLDRNLALDIEGSGGHRLLEPVRYRVTELHKGFYQINNLFFVSVMYISSESLAGARMPVCPHARMPPAGSPVRLLRVPKI